MSTYTSHYPPAYSDTYVKATTYYSADTYPHFATDPSTPLTGTTAGYIWSANTSEVTDQKFNVDLGVAYNLRRLYVENFHYNGTNTNEGIKTVNVYGTNSATAFANTTYSNTDDLTLIDSIEVAEHSAANAADPQYFTFSSNEENFRYYVLRIADNWGNTYYLAVRRIELQSEDGLAFHTMDGGGVAGGEALIEANNLITMSGGAVCGGAGVIVAETSATMDGGGVAAGDADIVKIYKEVSATGSIGYGTSIEALQWLNSIRGSIGYGANLEVFQESSLSVTGSIGYGAVIEVTKPNALSVTGNIGYGMAMNATQDEVISMNGSIGYGVGINIVNKNLLSISGSIGYGSQMIIDIDNASSYSLVTHDSTRWT